MSEGRSQVPIEVHDMRLSFIWTETVLNLVGDRIPDDAPCSFLGRFSGYEPRFEGASGHGEADGLQLPWPGPVGQLFWTYYLEGHRPGDVSGTQAWKALVPFRHKAPLTVEAPWLPRRLLLEAFYYPHGLAFIVTASCSVRLALDEAIDMAFKVRRGEQFEAQWEGEAPKRFSLDGLAGWAAAKLRAAAFGSQVRPEASSVTPFTVVTVVRASGVDPDVPTPGNGEVHRALEALTGWRLTWRHDRIPDLADASLRIVRTAPASHVLYAGKRGRAVWFPGLFTLSRSSVRSLACYHRNLVLASAQVESLGGLVAESGDWLRRGNELPPTQSECARHASGILGRLFGGKPGTYRSYSTRTQIEQNDLMEIVNEVRDHFGMPALS
jgi:hypothetical protein